MFIEKPDGSVIIPPGGDIIDIAACAKKEGGRLLLSIPGAGMCTSDLSVGCKVLVDYSGGFWDNSGS